MSDDQLNRAVVLVDGMNLFNSAKRAFGYMYPNYDVAKLARVICAQLGCRLEETRFYTGVPRQQIDPERHHFWFAKSQANGTIRSYRLHTASQTNSAASRKRH